MKIHFIDHVHHAEYRSILRDARRNPTRRLSHRRETEVPVRALCQPFDIKGCNGPARLLIGTPESGHYEHTLKSVLPELDDVREAGITQVCLRLIKSFAETERTIDEHAGLIAGVRQHVGGDIRVTVDPFSLALTPELKWGVFSTTQDVLDVEASLDLIATAAVRFVQAGADGFLTLGRVPYEARVARAAIDAYRLKARVVSFSTNSETPNAYINDRKPGASPATPGRRSLSATRPRWFCEPCSTSTRGPTWSRTSRSRGFTSCQPSVPCSRATYRLTSSSPGLRSSACSISIPASDDGSRG